MDYVFWFVTPFVIGYLLAETLGFWRSLLVSMAALIAMIAVAYLYSINVISARWIEGAISVSPYAVIIVTPIYLVGIFVGCIVHNRSVKTKQKADVIGKPTTLSFEDGASLSAKLAVPAQTVAEHGWPVESLDSDSLNAPVSIPAKPKVSLKESTSPITTSIFVLTFILVALGMAYDFKRDSIEGDVKTYLLNNQQIIDKTGALNKDIHPSWLVGGRPQLTSQHNVYIYWVHGERGNFTVAINVDGSAINPKFSVNDIREGTMRIGEYRPN